MNRHSGIAGRRARDLVRRRRVVRQTVSTHDSAGDDPLLLMQRDVAERPAVDTAEHPAPSAINEVPAEAMERVASTPSAEEVAERVYRLFCQDLRRDRERRGRFT